MEKPIFDYQALYEQAKKHAYSEQFNCVEAWREFGYDEYERWKEDYRRAQRDLYWLATELLGFALVEKTHRPITDDFFIRKNPEIDVENKRKKWDWKLAVAKQSTIKRRLLIAARGIFKSTCDQADIIQWIICFPNIRILVMTAEQTLASQFVAAIKKFFWVSEKIPLTRFQMLFIQHCVAAARQEAGNEFTTAARIEEPAGGEPTILALSLGMSTAGKHFEIGKFDDCESEANSGPMATPEQRKKVVSAILLRRYLVDFYGYLDFIGTPYDSDGAMVALQSQSDVYVLKKPGWVVKEKAKGKAILELTPDDVDLYFPEDSNGVPRLDFKTLMGLYENDPYLFSCQILLDPKREDDIQFTEQMLRSHVVPLESFPPAGMYRIFQSWDLAHSDGRGSDYTVGSVGFFDNFGRVFIVDVVRGKFDGNRLAYEIARQAATWKPEKIVIEKSGAVQFLYNDIRRELQQQGYANCPIDYFTVDVTDGAKKARAELLQTYLLSDRFYMSEKLDLVETIVKEFVRFKPKSKRKDDIIDSFAHLIIQCMPPNVEVPRTEQERREVLWNVMLQKIEHDRVYCIGSESNDVKSGPFKPVPETPAPPPTHFEGLPIICPCCGTSPCLRQGTNVFSQNP